MGEYGIQAMGSRKRVDDEASRGQVEASRLNPKVVEKASSRQELTQQLQSLFVEDVRWLAHGGA